MDEEDLIATFGTANLYEILGVEKTCSKNILKKAYHKKSLEVYYQNWKHFNQTYTFQIYSNTDFTSKFEFLESPCWVE